MNLISTLKSFLNKNFKGCFVSFDLRKQFEKPITLYFLFIKSQSFLFEIN